MGVIHDNFKRLAFINFRHAAFYRHKFRNLFCNFFERSRSQTANGNQRSHNS